MPAPSDKPLRKVTINLFEEDVALFEKRYGRGWSEQLRRLMTENNKRYLEYNQALEEYQEQAYGGE